MMSPSKMDVGYGSISEEIDPLVGKRDQKKFNLFNGLCYFGFGLLVGIIFTHGRAKTTLVSSTTSEEEKEQPTTLQYRPVCMTYNSKLTARILQTSMGSPSQQWSHIPCYSQPVKVWDWAGNVKADVNLNEYSSPDAMLKVNFSQPAFAKERQILGFGAAFTEAASLNYQSLSEKGKETMMELFFGESGLGYTLGRVHINSCDFSVASYSFDTVDGDFDLEYFDMDVAHDSQPDGMIDMIKKASELVAVHWGSKNKSDKHSVIVEDGNFKMYASPWSPPAWMKQPTEQDDLNATHAVNMTGSTEPTCLREGTKPESRYAKAWALYFSKFLSAYAEHGIDFWAVTVQNEPEFPAPWEACAYTPKTMAEFVAYHLGPQLAADHPDVKILMFDHNKDHMINFAKILLNNTNPSAKYVQGTAYHWYAGGMDRLLDGAVGQANLHRFQSKLGDLMMNNSEKDVHVILNSEACHCPYTGYAGGDIFIYWSRAERYAHTILADLAAGSNGWVEWNLILDSVGGPNHLNNLCDTTILAVPHRAIVNGTEIQDIPPTLPFEKTQHPFGPTVGDTRTRAELNALGFPAKYLEDGLAVQPMYYYMGHISRYVRPGSRALHGLVEESSEVLRPFRSPGQVVAGGGFNDLARNGIEVTVWPCEGSTRQEFFFNPEKQIEVRGHDWKGKPTKSCLAKDVDKSFEGITLTDCKNSKAATFDLVEISDGPDAGFVKLIQTNAPTASKLSNRCLVISTLGNKGGAYGPKGGAQVVYGSCASPASLWKSFDSNGGEIISSFFEEGEVCMTTGWPFLQMGAFSTPNGESKNTVILLNEAMDSANYVLFDGDDAILSGSIPPRSIQTVLLDST